MSRGGAGVAKQRPAGHPRAFDNLRAPAIDRMAMTLLQIYKAGVGAGNECTGVYAVWMEGRGEKVIDEEGRYVGLSAVTTPWSLRVGDPLETEALPQAVYDVFKAALGGTSLDQALAKVYALGRSLDA